MIPAAVALVLGVLLFASGVGFECGWGWSAVVVGVALVVWGLLTDVDGDRAEEVV